MTLEDCEREIECIRRMADDLFAFPDGHKAKVLRMRCKRFRIRLSSPRGYVKEQFGWVASAAKAYERPWNDQRRLESNLSGFISRASNAIRGHRIAECRRLEAAMDILS